MTASPKRRPAILTAGSLEDLAALATGRHEALFTPDILRCHAQLKDQIAGRRILVIGGAGSIGAATVRAIVAFGPASLHVIDQNENSLVELVRDLRSRFDGRQLQDFRTLPLNFGTPIMERYLREEAPYDYALNFAALKHVRSEKDGYSILQMLDSNVIKPRRLLRWLVERGGVRGYFCVSTDKAANPVNLMGASKRLMEHVIFSSRTANGKNRRVTSARFANVAFSEGSLLQGWLMRLNQGQPMAVPRDTRRYFVSLEEAGQICLLAAFVAPDGHILVPRLDPASDLIDLSQLAGRVLNHFGRQPRYFEDEQAARAAAQNGSTEDYPLLLTPLDTTGEKPYEEFVGEGETTQDIGLTTLEAVPYLPVEPALLAALLDELEILVDSPQKAFLAQDLARMIQSVLPEFHHQSTPKGLDQRM